MTFTVFALPLAGLVLSGLLPSSAPTAVAGSHGAPLGSALDGTPDEPAWSDVRALLESNCLSCHGGEGVKGGLRLATAETFLAGGMRGPIFDKGQPSKSRLLHAISYKNPELSMPPIGQLEADQIALLTSWIEAGAPWPAGEDGYLADPAAFPETKALGIEDGADWWSYRPLVDPQLPGDAAHAIDSFIAARLDVAGLEQVGTATPSVLLRRATFDLTGLPPTPEDVRAFTADVKKQGFDSAWTALIERLLASPAYGEHWARHWLDLVRFAETNGYERDSYKKNMWRYRDWVIRAFNDDKPYDRFVIEQLAGDELAIELGGIENSAEAVDALLATGYYRLMVWDDEPADRVQAPVDLIADVVDTTGQVFMGMMVGCARCHDHKADPISQRDYYALTAFFNNMQPYRLNATREIADPLRPGVLTVEERDDLLAKNEVALAKSAEALGVIESFARIDERKVLVGDGRKQAATWDYMVSAAPDGWETPGFNSTSWKNSKGGFGHKGARYIAEEWKTKIIHLRTRFRLTEIPEAAVLSFIHDDDIEVFLNGELIERRGGSRGDHFEKQLNPKQMRAFVVGSNVLAVRCKQGGGGQHIDVGLSSGWLPGEGGWMARLKREHQRHKNTAAGRLAAAQFADRDGIHKAPVAEPYPANVASEKGGPGPQQHILIRGSAHARGEEVDPEIPSVVRHVLGPDARGVHMKEGADSRGRRLAFARWLMSEGSLLSARVMANRLWQFHFGRGLCRSPGDFGRLGTEPTHPILLDHLASKLIASDWSLKEMHRYIMASSAYRLSSAGSEEGLANDPRNDYFWRFDPRRLTAEEYRDSVLAANGSLNRKLHGPSVYPPMPMEALATSSRPGNAWGKATPEQAARRSIYIFVKRSLRMPLMESFDQPDPDLPCAARFPTNVPTQALITLNGDFTGNAAALMAERLTTEASTLKKRVALGIKLALSREADAQEVDRGAEFVRSMIAGHALEEKEALRLFCLSLYNRNEFLWVD